MNESQKTLRKLASLKRNHPKNVGLNMLKMKHIIKDPSVVARVEKLLKNKENGRIKSVEIVEEKVEVLFYKRIPMDTETVTQEQEQPTFGEDDEERNCLAHSVEKNAEIEAVGGVE